MKGKKLLNLLVFAFLSLPAYATNIETPEIKNIELKINQGKYQEAEDEVNKIIVNNSDNYLKGIGYYMLGNIKILTSNYDRALEYFNKAEEIAVKNKVNILRGKSIYGKARVALSKEEYEEAEKLLLNAKDFLQENKEDLAKLNNELGNLYFYRAKNDLKIIDRIEANKNINLAIAQYNISLAMYPLEGANNNLGSIYFLLNDNQNALKYYSDAYTLSIRNGNMYIQFQTLANLAQVYIKLKKDEEAAENLKKAIDIVEVLRSNFSSDKDKALFIEKKAYIYEELIKLLLRQKKYKEVWNYVERSKARSFLDSIGKAKFESELKNPELENLIKNERFLRDEIANSLLNANISNKINEYQYVINKITDIDPKFSTLISVNPASLDEIQAILKNTNKTIVEYYIGKDISLAFIIKGNKFNCINLTNNSKVIREKISIFLNNTGRYYVGNKLDENNWDIWKKDMSELYNIIFKPLESSLNEKDIYIIPHAELHNLPLEALINTENKFLIEQGFNFMYLPSASVLKFIKKNNKDDKALVIGNPAYPKDQKLDNLKGAEEEAKEIASILKTEAIINKKATETFFKENSSKYNLILLSTHAELYPPNPLESKIWFSDDSKNDGKLTVEEIFNLKLNTFLVTLSACESAQVTGFEMSDNLPLGDDLVSLSRSILYAGSTSVIASLWVADDSATKYIMENFYKNLNSGKFSIVESLRLAKISLIKDSVQGKVSKEWIHPNYWSLFNYFGEFQ